MPTLRGALASSSRTRGGCHPPRDSVSSRTRTTTAGARAGAHAMHMKVRRRHIAAKYRAEIDALYHADRREEGTGDGRDADARIA